MNHIVVFLLLLLLETCSAYENVALRGKATQSTRYGDAYAAASNAIDGNHESIYSYGSCSHSAKQTNPWWRVDLLDVYVISGVTIINRGDCCSDYINGAEIHIGNSLQEDGVANPLVAVIDRIPPGATYPFRFTPVEGRYVTVFLPGPNKYLALCEVEVYGYLKSNPIIGENMALPHDQHESQEEPGEEPQNATEEQDV